MTLGHKFESQGSIKKEQLPLSRNCSFHYVASRLVSVNHEVTLAGKVSWDVIVRDGLDGEGLVA